MIAGSVACGPSVAVSGDDDTSTSVAPTTTTSVETTTTDASVTVADVTTASPESTTTDATTSGTTTSADESSSSGEFECGCPDDMPIGLDDELPDGRTPAEVLAEFTALNLPLEWFAYGDATTMVHIDVTYEGGELTVGPGGEDGCQFLSSPCSDGVQMDVRLVATTDDGWLSLDVPARLGGYTGTTALSVEYIPIADNAGTLAMQPLQIAGTEFTVDSLHLGIEPSRSTKSGVRGNIGAEVSTADCGNGCEVDEDCGDGQTCIGNVCFGGQCNTFEALAEF